MNHFNDNLNSDEINRKTKINFTLKEANRNYCVIKYSARELLVTFLNTMTLKDKL